MKPTIEPQAILDAKVDPGSGLKVIAYAGTGKTSSLVALAEANDIEMLYLAFNKSVESEAKMRFPMNVTSRTGHALAYATTGAPYRTMPNGLNGISNLYNWQLAKAYQLSVYESSLLLHSLETYLCSEDDDLAPKHIQPDVQEKFPANLYVDEMMHKVELVWSDMKERRRNLPMTHSGYLKMFCLEHPNLEYPVVMLDEAQDTNPVMHRLMLDQMGYGHKVYFVGDPYQQIYSWRGAVDAMARLELPSVRLTQSFRFGPEVAGFASFMLKWMLNEKVPLIGLGGKGVVSGVRPDAPFTTLCRTNGGLVRYAYQYAVQGNTIHVSGPDAFQETLNTVDDCYQMWMNNKGAVVAKRIAYHKDFAGLKRYAEDCLDAELMSKILIAESFKTEWPEVRRIIDNQLTTASPEMLLSTCHKAKGLEWQNVVIGADFAELFVDPEALKPGESPRTLKKVVPCQTDSPREIHKEEVNLLYVACTRAKGRLTLTPDLQWLKDFAPLEQTAPIQLEMDSTTKTTEQITV